MPAILPLTCQTCGAAIDVARSEGVCAICLFGEALEQELNETFGGHELCGEIARGGMGVVYRAMQREPRREVALKTLRGTGMDSPEAQARFRDEARTMAELDDPGILPIYQFGQQDGVLFFTMKLAAGGTLAERTADYAGQWKKIAELIASVADAVQFAHEHGVLHRDIKPGNILFDEEGHAFVSDFGLAKLAERAEGGLTVSAAMLGTPHYMAPEIAAHGLRAATTATDVWSLGVVLYELLAQQRPFKSDSVPALMREVAEREPDVLAQNVPSDLRVITAKTLAKDPARRYATARALADDLRCWIEDKPITARPVSAMDRFGLWVRRNPVMAAMSALLAVSAMVVAALFIHVRNTANEDQRSKLIGRAIRERSSGRMGQRYSPLEALQNAAAIRMDTDIVSECATTLASVDLKARPSWGFSTVNSDQLPEYSPDLTQCAIPEVDGGFSLRSAVDGTVFRRFSARQSAIAFAFSSDGRSIAAKLTNDIIQIWDADGTAPLAEIPGPDVYGMKSGIAASFSKEHQAWAVAKKEGSILKVSLDGGTTVWIPEGESTAGSLRFDPQGGRLAAANRSGVTLWQMKEEAKKLWSIDQPATLAAMAWNPAGEYLAMTAQIGAREAVVLDALTGAIFARLHGPLQSITHMAFHPYRDLLAASSNDGTIRVWDYRDGSQLIVARASDRTLAWSPDGRRLGAAHGADYMQIFDFDFDTVLREFGGLHTPSQKGSTEFSVSPDQRLLVTINSDSVRLWSTAACQYLGEIKGKGIPAYARPFVTSDSQWCVFQGGSQHGFLSRCSLQISPEGDSIIIGKKEIIPGSEGMVLSQINPDGTWVLYSLDQRTWTSWPEGDVSRAVILLKDSSSSPSFSPDLHWAVSARPSDNRVKVRDRLNPSFAAEFPLKNTGPVRWSPDSRWVLVRGDEANLLLAAADWHEQARIPTDGDVYGKGCAAFSADSKRLAMAVGNESIQILSVPELRLIVSLTPPLPLDFRRVIWSRDGGKLWAMDVAGRIFEWDLAGLQGEMKKLGMEWRR